MHASVRPSAHFVLYPPKERSSSGTAPRPASAAAAAAGASQGCLASRAAPSQAGHLSSSLHQPPLSELHLSPRGPHRRTHRKQQALRATLGSSAAPPFAHEPLQGAHTEHMMGEAGFLQVHTAAEAAHVQLSDPQWQQLDEGVASGKGSSNGSLHSMSISHQSSARTEEHSASHHQHHLKPGDGAAAPAGSLLGAHTQQAQHHAASPGAIQQDSGQRHAASEATPRRTAEQRQPEAVPPPSFAHQPPLQAEGAHAAPQRVSHKPGPVVGGRWGKWVLHMRPWYAHVRPWWSRRSKRRRKPKPNRFRMTVSRSSDLDVLQEFLRCGQLRNQAIQQRQLPASAPASAPAQQPQHVHHLPGKQRVTPLFTTLLMQPRNAISRPSRSAIHTLGGAPSNRYQPYAHYTLDGGAHWASTPFCNTRTAQGCTLLAATLDCSSTTTTTNSSHSSVASASRSASAEPALHGVVQVVVSTHPHPPQPPETGTHRWRHHVLQLQPGACYMLEQEAAAAKRARSQRGALFPLSVMPDPLLRAALSPPSPASPAASLRLSELPPPSPLQQPSPTHQPELASTSAHTRPSPSRPPGGQHHHQHHHQQQQRQEHQLPGRGPELGASPGNPESQLQHHHHQQQQQQEQQLLVQQPWQQPQHHQQQQQQQRQRPQRPLFHRLLRQPTVLIASLHMVAGRQRSPDDDARTQRFQAAWRHSCTVHPSLLVYTSHRSWRSYLQLWQDKRHVLDSPDVLILANGTRIMYQVAGGGWQEDTQWRALLSQGWERARVVRAVETVAAAMNEAQQQVQAQQQRQQPQLQQQQQQQQREGTHVENSSSSLLQPAQQQQQQQREGTHVNGTSSSLPLQGLPFAAGVGERDAGGMSSAVSRERSARGPGRHVPQVLVRADVVKEQNAHRVRILVRAHAAQALVRALQAELEGARAQQQEEWQLLHPTLPSSSACAQSLHPSGPPLRAPTSTSTSTSISSDGTHGFLQPLPASCSLPATLVSQRHALAYDRANRPAPTPTMFSSRSGKNGRPGVGGESALRASPLAPQPLAWSLLLQPQHVLGHGRGWVAVDVLPEGAGVGPAVSHVLSRFGIAEPAGRQGEHHGVHVPVPGAGVPVVACTNTEHDAQSLQQAATHSIMHAPTAEQAGGFGGGGIGEQQGPAVANRAWGADCILEGLAKLGLS